MSELTILENEENMEIENEYHDETSLEIVINLLNHFQNINPGLHATMTIEPGGKGTINLEGFLVHYFVDFTDAIAWLQE